MYFYLSPPKPVDQIQLNLLSDSCTQVGCVSKSPGAKGSGQKAKGSGQKLSKYGDLCWRNIDYLILLWFC